MQVNIDVLKVNWDFRLFASFGKIFTFVESDVRTKEQILDNYCTEDSEHYVTVKSMVNWEIKDGIPPKKEVVFGIFAYFVYFLSTDIWNFSIFFWKILNNIKISFENCILYAKFNWKLIEVSAANMMLF